MNCQHCQALLLDHLYGLLDGAEADAVRAHLDACPQCTAARAGTARVQGLFARAAKGAFPKTKFEPPALERPARVTSPTVPANEPRHAAGVSRSGMQGGVGWRVAAVLPWAVAAAVLLAVPGTVVPVLSVFDRAEAASRDAAAARRAADAAQLEVAQATRARDGRLGDAQHKLARAEQTKGELLDRWVDEQKVAVLDAAARKLTVDVWKPATVQPGAANDFYLVVNDAREVWQAANSRLVAEVRASDAVLFTQELNHEKTGHTQHPIRLPAGVWARVKPDTELTLVVAQVDGKTRGRTPLQEVRLAGPVFTTLLTTDKQTYRPGERLFFRSLTLDRVTLKPPPRDLLLRYDLVSDTNPQARALAALTATGTTDLVRVADAGRVEPVRTADGQPVRGVGCGEFVLPADLPDGDYTLVLRELQAAGGPAAALPVPVTRTVRVRAGAADHFAKRIGFGAAAYRPGDPVTAWAELKWADKPVEGAEVVGVTVEADGVPVAVVDATPRTDASGRAQVRFALPDEVLNGDVRLKVVFRSGGREEAVADRLPVVGHRLHVEFFPESGDALVAGVPCKVYVRATTPAGRPVDVRGVVTDGRETLAAVDTLRAEGQPGANRGLAAFTITPKVGTKRLWFKLDAPHAVYAPIMLGAPVRPAAVALMGGPAAVALNTGFVLPEVKLGGVVMSVPDPITAPGQPLRVSLHSPDRPRTLVVGAYTRGRVADTQRVTVAPGQAGEARLMAGADPRGGVVRVTAFEEVPGADLDGPPDLKPVAERLVFRRPGEVLKLALDLAPPGVSAGAVAPGAALAFAPGAPLTCAIRGTDENNNPTAAVLWASVVNTGAAPGAMDRTLPTHFLLAGELKSPDDLEYADFLLTGHPKAPEVLDLVLGTQGWRRFAEQPKAPANRQLAPAQSPELARLMLQNGQHAVLAEPTAGREYRRIAETYGPLYEAAVQAVAKARAALQTAESEAQTRDASAVRAAEAEVASAARAALAQEERAEAARGPVRQFRSVVWYGIAGFAALALLCGGVSLVRPGTRLPLGASTLGSFGLAAFLVVAAGWGEQARSADARPTAEPHGAVPHPEPTAPGAAPHQNTEAERRSESGGATGATAPSDTSAAERPPAALAPGGGFGGTGTPPRATNQMAREPGYGLTLPSGLFLPNPGRGGDTTGGANATGSVPVRPGGPKTDAKADAAAPPAPGAAGWKPHNRDGVTAADLAEHAPAPFFKADAALRNAADDRAAALRKSAELAAKYTDERQQVLTQSLEAQLGGRAGAKRLGPAAAAVANAGKVEAQALQQVRGSVNLVAPLVVREYAAPRPAAEPLPDAADSPDTILWQPVIVLPTDGRATLGFNLGNAPGGYQLVVAGHTADGRLGEARVLVRVGPLRPVPTGSVPPVVPVAPGSPRGP